MKVLTQILQGAERETVRGGLSEGGGGQEQDCEGESHLESRERTLFSVVEYHSRFLSLFLHCPQQ